MTARWMEAMYNHVVFLDLQQRQNVEFAAMLTRLDLPNLFALLNLVQRAGDPEATIDLATSLYVLLQQLGKPRLLECLGQVRDAAAKNLETMGDTWSHARFQVTRTRIEQHLVSGRVHEAFEGAQQLLQYARLAGEQAYPEAEYDLALACMLLARVLHGVGAAEKALPLLDEASQRFGVVAKKRVNSGVEMMMFACLLGQGNCLLNLGRLDEAATAYEEGIRRAEQEGADRNVAVGKLNLGTLRLNQRLYSEALEAYADARERFTQLGEPITVGEILGKIGWVCRRMGQPEAAENAYRQSLAISVQFGDVDARASTLCELGLLYGEDFGRLEEAASFFRQAVDIYTMAKNKAREGAMRSNYASTLRKLCRLDKARQEILRGIECMAHLGHQSEPWKAWAILAEIETDAGNLAAAAGAKGKAIARYLAYRRDGGENHSGSGRLILRVTDKLCAGATSEAASAVQDEAARYETEGFGSFIRALQAIVAGSRDRTPADDPDLDYTMAAEILFLIETLEKSQ